MHNISELLIKVFKFYVFKFVNFEYCTKYFLTLKVSDSLPVCPPPYNNRAGTALAPQHPQPQHAYQVDAIGDALLVDAIGDALLVDAIGDAYIRLMQLVMHCIAG